MSEEQTKKITFEGGEYEVPLWVNWVAKNAYGWVYGFESKPTIPIKDHAINWGFVGQICLIYKPSLWKTSLTKAPDNKGESGTPDREFLMWLHERLEHTHGDHPRCDFMHKLRAIIQTTDKNQITRNTGSFNDLDELQVYLIQMGAKL